MDLEKSMMISAAGLRAQSTRMRIISENLANQESIAASPEEDPYRRKIVSFKNVMDNELGIRKIVIDKIIHDQAEFGSKYDPGHPAADDTGYVKTSNVRGMIESIDLQQAQRSYQANLNAIEASRNMLMQTLELLR
jgi:flagellar basal-body rod protein FlgC